MACCFVGVGTNVDKVRNLSLALTELRRVFGALRQSAIYETTPIGFEGETFFNVVVSFESMQPPEHVAKTLRDLEFKQGRTPNSVKFAPRPIDLDLLLYDDCILNTPTLKLPRPDIEQYLFVLQPLAELAPDLTHPIRQQTYRQMLESQIKERLVPLDPHHFEYLNISHEQP